MATVRGAFRRAVSAHREALGLLRATRDLLEGQPQEPVYSAESLIRQAGLAERLQQAGEALVQGWGTQPWDRLLGGPRPVGQASMTEPLLRIGTAHPVADGFPVLVPFLGAGHICIDVDARDPDVAGLIRGVLLRVLGTCRAGTVRVLAVDAGTLGSTFTPLLPLVAGELMTPPVIDLDGLRQALNEAEEHVRRRRAPADQQVLVLAIAGFPSGCSSRDFSRVAALAHAGPPVGLHLLVAGYPAPGTAGSTRPTLDHATVISRRGDAWHVGDPPGQVFAGEGRGINSPVRLDTGPPDDLIGAVCRSIAGHAVEELTVSFAELMPKEFGAESSVSGLRTLVGRAGHEPVWLSLDDATPHWLVGGRTGSGKTVFLLGALYGLAARYSADELALYLLDFKEGVSFTEFTPTAADQTWVPHARTVGVESDREYGVAVLAALSTEMGRRAKAMKQVGVTNLAQLRSLRPDVALPRVVAVIDEFQVLFSGSDATARRAGALLEDIARRGRSYGIHLIMSSQTTSGIDPLVARGEALFGQFSQRIALSGGGDVLAASNRAADALPIGTAILNASAGAVSGNQEIRFPDTDPDAVRRIRRRLWAARAPGEAPPAVFAGYAEQRIEDDPTMQRLDPQTRRRAVLVGRAVDVGLPTASFLLDSSPGRHLAVLGTSEVGADVLHAAVVGLARQHAPGTAEFVLAGLVAGADDAADGAATAVREAGHRCSEVEPTGLRGALARLAHPEPTDDLDPAAATAPPSGTETRPQATYVVVWGADAAGAVLRSARDPRTGATGLEDLRTVLQEGPARGIHLVAWWRGLRRFSDDLGSGAREDVAGLVALNVNAKDLGILLGQYTLEWNPRPNRALFIDRHTDKTTLIVPFVREGRHEGVSL